METRTRLQNRIITYISAENQKLPTEYRTKLRADSKAYHEAKTKEDNQYTAEKKHTEEFYERELKKSEYNLNKLGLIEVSFDDYTERLESSFTWPDKVRGFPEDDSKQGIQTICSKCKRLRESTNKKNNLHLIKIQYHCNCSIEAENQLRDKAKIDFSAPNKDKKLEELDAAYNKTIKGIEDEYTQAIESLRQTYPEAAVLIKKQAKLNTLTKEIEKEEFTLQSNEISALGLITPTPAQANHINFKRGKNYPDYTVTLTTLIEQIHRINKSYFPCGGSDKAADIVIALVDLLTEFESQKYSEDQISEKLAEACVKPKFIVERAEGEPESKCSEKENPLYTALHQKRNRYFGLFTPTSAKALDKLINPPTNPPKQNYEIIRGRHGWPMELLPKLKSEDRTEESKQDNSLKKSPTSS
jgi:hypothetical protein